MDVDAPIVEPRVLEALHSGAQKLPGSEGFPLPACVACPGGCSHEVFCSERCAATAWAAHERCLCCGPGGAAPDKVGPRRYCSPHHRMPCSRRAWQIMLATS